jgi:hypothetical protein
LTCNNGASRTLTQADIDSFSASTRP